MTLRTLYGVKVEFLSAILLNRHSDYAVGTEIGARLDDPYTTGIVIVDGRDTVSVNDYVVVVSPKKEIDEGTCLGD